MSHYADKRIVWTYEPGDLPLGLIVARLHGTAGLVIEHVVVFPQSPKGTLPAMLQAALREVRTRGYRHLVFALPRAVQHAPRLAALGRRYGFRPYALDEAHDFYVAHVDDHGGLPVASLASEASAS